MILPAAALTIWLLGSYAALIKLARYRKKRLLTCPDSGTIALVDIQEVPPADKRAAGVFFLKVKNCQLWPERRECKRECLPRCTETWGSYAFNVASVAPYEKHGTKQ
jgi:hypothetical protein